MTKLVEMYYSIMARYRNGEFGAEHLTLHEVLVRAREPDLFSRMSIEELECLRNKSSGLISYYFFGKLISQRKNQLKENCQNFDVLAVSPDKPFVVTPDKVEELKSSKQNPEDRLRMDERANEFKVKNLGHERTGSTLKRTRRKPGKNRR